MIALSCAANPDASASSGAFSSSYQAYQTALETGDEQAVETAAANAYKLGEQEYGVADTNTAALAMNWASALLALPAEPNSKRKAEHKQAAYTLYQQAFSIREGLSGKESVDVLDPLLGMANSSETPEKAKQHFERAIDIAENSGQSLLVAYVKTDAFNYLSKTHLYTNTVKRYAFDAYDTYVKELPADSIARVKATFTLGAVQFAHKHYDKAEPLLLEVIKQFDALKFTHPYALSAHAYLVEMYEREGESDKSTAHCVAIGSMQPWSDTQEQTPIYRIAPEYPRSAAQKGKSGWVEVAFKVDTNGFVKEPKVLDSKGGSGFEKTSLAALEKWRYAPKFVDGQPVVGETMVRLYYELR